jgi:4-carboxymuconolactone decarboxylase
MMNENDQHDRGLKLRTEMFGREAVEKRMNAFGEFGEPLQHIINAYAYGDVWSRTALPLATKSLVMVAMMAALGYEKELGVHIRGALKNGSNAEQIQEVLLLLALYCGIPAANEAHRIATDIAGARTGMTLLPDIDHRRGRFTDQSAGDQVRSPSWLLVTGMIGKGPIEINNMFRFITSARLTLTEKFGSPTCVQLLKALASYRWQ